MNVISHIPPQQRCRACGGVFDRDVFFRRRDKSGLHICSPRTRHMICLGCEVTARTDRKKANPWCEKARSTIKRHAAKYSLSVQEFVRLYGWDVPRVAHILEHAFVNTCVYCRKLYSSMENPQWQVTLDIIDPKKKPFLATNVQPCCQTCNREKSNLEPELWARKLQAWALWEDHQKRGTPPAVQLNLRFDTP